MESLEPPYEILGELDKPHEECGVTGVLVLDEDIHVAKLIGEGLQSLQHRGQEAAGVAVSVSREGQTERNIEPLKNVGLVQDVMGGYQLDGMPLGKMAIGHVRYGTMQGIPEHKRLQAAGPFICETEHGPIAVAHNGHINNPDEIRNKYDLEFDEHATDSAIIAEAIAKSFNGKSLEHALVDVLSMASGAFSIVVMGDNKLIGVRDPFGFRPLMLGSYADGGKAIASEVPAIRAMGASYRREISRGEMVVCNADGSMTTTYPFEEQPSRLCSFELIYFSAPHGELEGRSIHMVRKRMGEILAKEHPVDADVVIGVPDSGIPASEGYAQASGIPRVSGLMKNKYLSKARTFIVPGQENREAAVSKKLQVVGPEVYGKRIVLVDDSIVRGTTNKKIVAMLRDEGASEVHLRISSSPYLNPCYYGMDTRNPDELIANKFRDLQQLTEYLDVDSLEYLSINGLRAAAADAAGKLCMACMDGKYPTPIPSKP